jgi:Flagellar assembly protein FliH
MRWFETPGDNPKGKGEHLADAPRRVKFTNVSQERERLPSWMPAARRRVAKKEETPSLAPPRVPSEFVDAIRQELDPDRASRPPRASERARPATQPVSLAPPAVAAEPAPPQFIVDPEATAAFERAVELLVSERARVLEQTAGQLGELATIIARRVIAHEISLKPGLIAGLVREGLEALGAHDRVLVRVGRGFEQARNDLEQRLADRGAHAEVRFDPSLDEYGCVVETELGSVDESIESRITTLLNALKPDSDAPQRDGE